MSITKQYKTRSFAAFHRNEEVRGNSSSGGVFYAVAKKVIEAGGIVFGAAFDDDGQVVHKGYDDLSELNGLMRSKYVQSNMGTVFNQVKDLLTEGREVLFTGTPCQVYGLLSFIKMSMGNKIPEQLITADFICHGVPSRLVWRKYLAELSGERQCRSINFRDKTNGWRDFSLKITFDDESQYLCSWHKDPYLQGFIKNLYLRESCYRCQFRGIDRESDFTFADFWGVHTVLPEMYDDKGTSIIMAHNDKAVEILESIKSEMIVREINNDMIVEKNSMAVRSVAYNSKRDVFFDTFPNNDMITKHITRFVKESFARRVIRKIKSVLK